MQGGQLRHRAFILDQRGEPERAGPLELSITVPAGVRETTVAEIEGLTELRFTGIV